ncbi:MAG: hypothetical protein SNJ82_02445 [Gemmataceae bacterium]
MKETNRCSSDPLDGLLRAYFRSEMPSPWPAFRPTRTQRPARPVSLWSGYASRLALAASVAFLLLTGYFLASGSLGNGVGPHFGPLHDGKAAKEPLPEMPDHLDD